MGRQNLYPPLMILASFLVGCSSLRQPPPTALPTAAAAVSAPYDGPWRGQGTAIDGRAIQVSFTVTAGSISSFTYTYLGLDGTTCTGIDHQQIPPSLQPAVKAGTFSAMLGDDLTVSGSFLSTTSARGHILAQWKGRLNCSTSIEADWIATRNVPATQTIVTAYVKRSWCGTNVNCRDLLLQLLIFGLVNGAILALNALGVTVIYSAVRTLNLAHGDVYALSTAFVTSAINMIGLNPNWPIGSRLLILGSVLAGVALFGAILSIGVEELAFRPFHGRSRLAPVIASLGLSFILYQGALLWRTYQKSFIRGEHRSVPGLPEVPTDGTPNFLPHGNLLSGKVILPFSDLFVFLAAIALVLLTTYILARTPIGRCIRAVAQNEDLAQIVGIDRNRAIRRAFALGGALAGAAAFIFAMYYARPFGKDGAESGLIAFAAALMGGVGSPVGALFSSLLLGVGGALSDYFLTTQWTPVLLLGLLTGLLVWRRGGFVGESITEEVAARDSVVLTAPEDSARARRWLIGLLLALAVLPPLATAFVHR